MSLLLSTSRPGKGRAYGLLENGESDSAAVERGRVREDTRKQTILVLA
jgi:hypothetical protein